LNYVGWSAFSPTMFALVAVAPSAPAKPELIAATQSTITLQLYQSLNSGGS
jgi:Fibronectin type III domain